MMKVLTKKLLHTLFVLLVLPLVILYGLAKLFIHQDSLFAAYSQLFSLVPGKFGSYLRTAFFRWTMSTCEQDCFIGFGALFSHADTELQHGIYIGPQCNIGKCRIEQDCLLGSGVHILSGKSQHAIDDLSKPIRDQHGHFEKITIGRDSWLGNGAIVMANVGKHCVVAAGAVVTQDVPNHAIVAGNPARVIKSRLGSTSNNRAS